METNEKIYARTNAEFINKLFKKKYKQWMNCRYKLKEYNKVFLWFLPFDGTKNATGWRNYIDGENVVEEYDDPNELMYRPTHEFIGAPETRLIFNKIKVNDGFCFVFLGAFRLEKCSTNWKRVWKSVPNIYVL